MPRHPLTRVLADRHVAVGPLAYALRLGIAASLAFAVTTLVLDTPQPPLLAPWTAVFALYPTVIESFRGALRRVAALALGALVAVGMVALTGTTFVAVAVVVTLAGLVGRWPRLGEQGIQVPGGAVLVLVMAQRNPLDYLVQFGVETTVGVLAALLVNGLAPPLQMALVRDTLDRLRDRVAQLLEDVADEADGNGGHLDWRDWGRRMDSVVAEASSVVGQSRESTRLNLRRRHVHVPRQAARTLDVLEHASLESRNIARGLFAHEEDDTRDLFTGKDGRDRLAATLRQAAAAVRALRIDGGEPHDGEVRAHLDDARDGLAALGGEVHAEPGLGQERRYAWSREHAVLVAVGRLLTELDRTSEAPRSPAPPSGARPPSPAGRRGSGSGPARRSRARDRR
jgi:uncharacterized membrane protein YgaE (UPF0421/DUF939 family)